MHQNVGTTLGAISFLAGFATFGQETEEAFANISKNRAGLSEDQKTAPFHLRFQLQIMAIICGKNVCNYSTCMICMGQANAVMRRLWDSPDRR
jgi:hypothetical protein